METYDLSVVVGVFVSLAFQLLKKLKWVNATDAVAKQVTVAVLAAITVGQASGWHLDVHVASQMALAALMAWATHKGLLAQVPVVETKAKTSKK